METLVPQQFQKQVSYRHNFPKRPFPILGLDDGLTLAGSGSC
jgi:hypothetical protein